MMMSKKKFNYYEWKGEKKTFLGNLLELFHLKRLKIKIHKSQCLTWKKEEKKKQFSKNLTKSS